MKKILLAVSIVAILVLVVFGSYIRFYSPLDYDRDAWKAARLEGDYRICHRMREDLIEKLSAARLSSAQLREELGEPDPLVSSPVYWRYRVKSTGLIFPSDSFIDVSIQEGMVSRIQYVRG